MLSDSPKLRNFLTFVSRFGIGMSIANFKMQVLSLFSC